LTVAALHERRADVIRIGIASENKTKYEFELPKNLPLAAVPAAVIAELNRQMGTSA
jgi:hypothetical protein